MEFIKNTLACSICSKTLQSPVALPCGATICKNHVNEHEKEFDCTACSNNHPIPKSGFKINEILDKILKSKLNNLHFGEEYQAAVDALKKLEEFIKNYCLLKQDPNFEIDKAIGDLKGNIDLKREQLKHGIDNEADKLIQQVTHYQNECKKKAKELDFKQSDEKVKVIAAEVEKSKKELSLLVIDKPKWKAIQKSLEDHSKILNDEFKRIRTQLFSNQLDIYQRDTNLDFFVENTNSRLNILNSKLKLNLIFLLIIK
jgi:hypothetical protein